MTKTGLLDILYVRLGSGIGGVCRLLVPKLFSSVMPGIFPWGTLAVNLGGCFLIGLIYGFTGNGATPSPGLKLFLTVGFCGGFTTFSTFVNESYLIFGGANPGYSIIYACGSLLFGLLMLWTGYSTAEFLCWFRFPENLTKHTFPCCV